MPNIGNVKNNTKDAGKGKGGSTQAGVLLLKTESTDRETANTSKIGATTGSNQKRIVSNPASYVKIQNSELSSTGTADAAFQSGGLPSNTNYANGQRGGIPHTLGNTLGGNK